MLWKGWPSSNSNTKRNIFNLKALDLGTRLGQNVQVPTFQKLLQQQVPSTADTLQFHRQTGQNSIFPARNPVCPDIMPFSGHPLRGCDCHVDRHCRQSACHGLPWQNYSTSRAWPYPSQPWRTLRISMLFSSPMSWFCGKKAVKRAPLTVTITVS